MVLRPARKRRLWWLTVCTLGVVGLMFSKFCGEYELLQLQNYKQLEQEQYQQNHQETQQHLKKQDQTEHEKREEQTKPTRPPQRNEKEVDHLHSIVQVSKEAASTPSGVTPYGPSSNSTKPPLYPPAFRLSNLSDFAFTINNDVCGHEPVDFVMLITSDVRSPTKRTLIREVLPAAVLAELRVRRVFLLGELEPPGNSSAQHDPRGAARQEDRQYADLVAGSFLDTYRNLTYKHLMGLHWATSYCPQARHIVKMDQDVAIDVFRLHTRLQTAPSQQTIIGALRVNGPPVRNPKSPSKKWYVTRQEFAGDKYPTYMLGPLYVITPDVAAQLVAGSARVPFFWVDDVFVTGVLRERAAPGATMLDFNKHWGRPDDDGKTSHVFTLRSNCLIACSYSEGSSVDQCDTLFVHAPYYPQSLRRFMKQAEYCYRRPQSCARRKIMPGACKGRV